MDESKDLATRMVAKHGIVFITTRSWMQGNCLNKDDIFIYHHSFYNHKNDV